MKDSQGTKRKDMSKVLEICTDFYRNHYSDSVNLNYQYWDYSYISSDHISPISATEVISALRKLKYAKSPGDDGFTVEEP